MPVYRNPEGGAKQTDGSSCLFLVAPAIRTQSVEFRAQEQQITAGKQRPHRCFPRSSARPKMRIFAENHGPHAENFRKKQQKQQTPPLPLGDISPDANAR